MISINVLGPTEVIVDGRLVPSASLAGRQRQILQILAMEKGSAVPKERLADLLWDGEPPTSYIGTLESYVCVLRRTLGLSSGRTSSLATTARGYLLDGDDVTIDLRDFGELIAAAPSASAREVVSATAAALRLVRGDLLVEEPYAAWAVRARDDFTRTLVAACAHAAALANETGDFHPAEILARRAIAADRLSEEGWQQLMRTLWLTGRRCDALRAYADLRQALVDELGEEPGVQSQQLYLSILRDTPTASPNRASDEVGELRTLMLLLRQVLDVLPGVGAPVSDAALTTVAARVCAEAV
jgi:SARP family transcriptional regulator, regulator of embCAB operon